MSKINSLAGSYVLAEQFCGPNPCNGCDDVCNYGPQSCSNGRIPTVGVPKIEWTTATYAWAELNAVKVKDSSGWSCAYIDYNYEPKSYTEVQRAVADWVHSNFTGRCQDAGVNNTICNALESDIVDKYGWSSLVLPGGSGTDPLFWISGSSLDDVKNAINVQGQGCIYIGATVIDTDSTPWTADERILVKCKS